jgi:hypothetical protein
MKTKLVSLSELVSAWRDANGFKYAELCRNEGDELFEIEVEENDENSMQ